MSVFGDPRSWPVDDLIGWSTQLTPELALAGYREGVFPMPVENVFGWFSPLQRGVLPLDGLRVSRSLRRSAARYRTTTNHAFARVLERCADPSRPGWWISDEITDTYLELHRRGFAQSVEAWDDTGRLVGGLYGVRVGRLFAGESMFHDPEHGRDASKVALMALVDHVRELGDELLDVQWRTPHLAGLGVIEVPRADYLPRAADAAGRDGRPWELAAAERIPPTVGDGNRSINTVHFHGQ